MADNQFTLRNMHKKLRIRAVKVPSSGQIKFCEMDVAFGGCKIAKTTQHLQLP